ncbi:MAG TPA: glutamate 5-kinase [Herpetosiphonaceae bacterium]|nr:glutamate 5-kinase [Herpetosiphonaceae bacterium]
MAIAAPRYKRVVVKLGTSVLSAGSDRLNRPRMVELVRQLAALMAQRVEPVLVSSGAVLAGWEQLGFPARRRNLPDKQLLAAVGQGRLMHLYAQLADLYGMNVAQTLLTRDDLRDRRRYLNARNTLLACIARGVVPVVNENDVVAVDEIRVGDNDNLSALVANLVEADLLLICTDIAGLYSADPRIDPDARLIPEVDSIDAVHWAGAGAAGTHRGTGGMMTKLQAAELSTSAGTDVIIAAGDAPDVILRAAAGEPIGTRFRAKSTRLEARKRWILAETVRHSRIVVDAGAAEALLRHGRSLLAAGVRRVEGTFERGQTVRIFDGDGRELARGLTQYNAAALSLIQGRRSSEIPATLGYMYGPEVVHRDDLVMLVN